MYVRFVEYIDVIYKFKEIIGYNVIDFEFVFKGLRCVSKIYGVWFVCL